MSWLTNLFGRTKAKPAAKRNGSATVATAFNDGFQAGKRDRLTEDWSPANLSPTQLHRADADLMRNRARDLVINNPFAKSAVGAYTRNVIGCGITPKPTFEGDDQKKAWAEGWNWWTGEYKNEADITEDQNFYELQALWLEEVIVGGGCLVHYVTLGREQRNGRSVPLALELIPEERFADEKDDFIVSRNRKKGSNPIVRGIEIDQATGRHVAYWIRPQLQGDDSIGDMQPYRLDVANCKYSRFKRRAGQVRGYSLLHAGIMWLWKLGFYVDNELMASAMKSCFAVVIGTDNEGGDFNGLEGDEPTAALTDVNGNALERIEPGIVARLKKGDTVTGVGPNTPSNEQHAWMLLIQRAISIALDLSYEEACRDYSQGNFSSTRASANADRQGFRAFQQFTVRNLCRPTDLRFTSAAVLAGLDGFPSIDDFAGDMRSFMRRKWRPPGWASVNPFDDVRAAAMKVEKGLGTREDYVASEGGDWEEVDEQLEREEKSASDKNLRFSDANQAAMNEPGGQAVEEQTNQPKKTNATQKAA
jgi:lambda family phage portal protein